MNARSFLLDFGAKVRVTRSRLVKAGCIVILVLDMLLQPWLAVPSFTLDEVGYYKDGDQRIHLVGSVAGEPDVRSDSQHLVIAVKKIFLPSSGSNRRSTMVGTSGADARTVHGKIMVKTDRYPEYAYGEVLDIACQLQTPPVFEKFSYAGLLAENDIFVLCTRASIKRDAVSAGGMIGQVSGGQEFFQSAWRTFWQGVFTLKSLMIARMNALYPEPQASLAAGILIGARRAIPQEILHDFNTAGLTHVLAISGYNVSMMITVFGFLFKRAARRWRYAGMLAGVSGLVVLTGFSASVLRAAWMGCIALLAQAFGRKGSALHLLLVSGVIMVLLNPRMILVDLSFQLSFLSTLGILLFMPKIEAFEKKLSESRRFPRLALFITKIPAFMREGFEVTLAAQVFTMPLLLYQFGRFSLIAPVANIFVLPLVPWIMLFSFLGLALSFLFLPLGQLVSFAAYVLISLMLFFVDVFARLPFAALQF